MERSIMIMLARTADGAMLADERGQVIFWNKAAERLLGFRAGEVLGRPCHEVMRGETTSGHPFCSPSCAIGHQLGCGRAVRHFDIQTRTKAGKVMWLNVSSLPVPSRKPNRFRFVHLFRDISNQAKVRFLVDELQMVLCLRSTLPLSRRSLSPFPMRFLRSPPTSH
jgi:PAS domain S-box-containing protein